MVIIESDENLAGGILIGKNLYNNFGIGTPLHAILEQGMKRFHGCNVHGAAITHGAAIAHGGRAGAAGFASVSHNIARRYKQRAWLIKIGPSGTRFLPVKKRAGVPRQTPKAVK